MRQAHTGRDVYLHNYAVTIGPRYLHSGETLMKKLRANLLNSKVFVYAL